MSANIKASVDGTQAIIGVGGVDQMTVSNAGVVTANSFVGAISNTNVTATGSTTARTLANRFADVVNVLDFGADPTGAVDSTDEIQDALNTSSTSIYFPKGTYLISNPLNTSTPVLTSSVDNRVISGDGVITANAQVKVALKITGNNTIVNGLRIDGNNNIGYAIDIAAENPTVTGCYIHDLNGFNDWGGIAIRLDLDGFDTTALISNNTIKNLQGIGDGTGGNGIGMQRAITINSNQNCTKKIFVTGNNIEKVEGEEGDAIVVISSNGSGTYYDLPVVISNNTVNLWTRRAVKIQANQVTVNNNFFTNDRPTALASLQRVIDIVQGGNHTVNNNTFSKCKFQSQISCFLTSPETASNFNICNNTIEGLGIETTNNAIAFRTYGENVVISGNVINCPLSIMGEALFLQEINGLTIASNVINTANTTIWYDLTSSTNIRIVGNIVKSPSLQNFTGFFDLTKGEFNFNVSNGRKLTLYQSDTTLSDGEIASKISCRQNDVSSPDTIHASVGFIAEGSSGSLGVGIFTGSVITPDTEKVRVQSSGILRPTTDGTQDLGTASYSWKDLFYDGAVNPSDDRLKTYFSIEDAEKSAAIEIKSNIRKFKFNSAIDKKGDGARIHWGVSAQQVAQIMKSHGLDPEKYSFYCYDEWQEELEVVGENGSIVRNYKPPGNKYGIKYTELLAFIISAL